MNHDRTLIEQKTLKVLSEVITKGDGRTQTEGDDEAQHRLAWSQRDILTVIFSNLSSYKRSKICTVCKAWADAAIYYMSLIEVAPNTMLHITKDHYHTLVRMKEIPVLDVDMIYISRDKNIQSSRLYALSLEKRIRKLNIPDIDPASEPHYAKICNELFTERLEYELDNVGYNGENPIFKAAYMYISQVWTEYKDRMTVEDAFKILDSVPTSDVVQTLKQYVKDKDRNYLDIIYLISKCWYGVNYNLFKCVAEYAIDHF